MYVTDLLSDNDGRAVSILQGIQEDYSSVYVCVNDRERLRIVADP